MHAKTRIAHACERCQRMRTKCSGGVRCLKCETDDVECVYSDRKREKNKKYEKELDKTKSSVFALQAKNKRLMSLLANLVAATNVECEVRTEAAKFIREDAEELPPLSSGTEQRSDSTPIIQGCSENNREQQLGTQLRVERSIQKGRSTRVPHKDFGLVGPSRLSQLSRLKLTDNGHSPSQTFPPAAWTQVTDNDNLVQHLLSLYFCWEYPVFASLSREHFLLDLYSGNRAYCSPLLVNAILALGARFSDFPEARKDKDDPSSAGDQFYEEAQKLLGYEDVPSLTLMQALGLMSLRQASSGNDMSGWHLSRLAMRTALDLGLHLAESQDARADHLLYSSPERQVSAATFWGCYTLEQAWCICVGRLPQISRDEIKVQKPVQIDEIEHEPWKPYTDQGIDPAPLYHQPGNIRSVYKAFAELSELVDKTNLSLQSENTRDIKAQARAVYTEYLQFYGDLPDALRLGSNSTPAVLFAHIYFHFAVLLLFRPFFNTGILENVITTRRVCAEATESILGLTKSYKNLYTLRRTPAFVPYLVMSAELGRLADHKIGPNQYELYRTPSVDYLLELSAPHPFARRAVAICDFFRRGWQIEFDPDERQHDAADVREMALPHDMTFFRPDVDLERHHDGSVRSAPMRSQDTEQTRFTPFPLQGKVRGILSPR